MAPVSVDAATDAAVHLLPQRVIDSLRSKGGWSGPTEFDRLSVESTLRRMGVDRYFALPVAPEPGFAQELNEWVIQTADASEMAVPFATVHPDDSDPVEVVHRAVSRGAAGITLHCEIGETSPVDPRLDSILTFARRHDVPVRFEYADGPPAEELLSDLDDFRREYPGITLCLALADPDDVGPLLERTFEDDDLFLDLTRYLAAAADDGSMHTLAPGGIPDTAIEGVSDSLLFGSGYPNLREGYAAAVNALKKRSLSEDTYRDVFGRTADRFLSTG